MSIHLANLLRLGLILLAASVLLGSCTYDHVEEEEEDLLEAYSKITLRWIRNYPDETREEMLTGFYWGLSHLGAKLPKSDESNLIQWIDDDSFEINFNFAGFDTNAVTALSKLNKVLVNSEEYEEMDGIDLGRYIMLTINSSNHYFKITGISETLDDFTNRYNLPYKVAHVDNSSIATADRVLGISNATQHDEVAYVASEGLGELSDGTFEIDEHETLDVMDNGQIRFGLFDLDGELKAAASADITIAGKPAKCMWCHESTIQRFFVQNPLYEEVMTADEFLSIRLDYHELIDIQRAFVGGLIKYENTQDHAFMELLYISFTEPSIRRLALEWQMTEPELETLLANESTHKNGEFGFLGQALYWRKDIDKYSPYAFIQTPTDPREKSVYEPNLID